MQPGRFWCFRFDRLRLPYQEARAQTIGSYSLGQDDGPWLSHSETDCLLQSNRILIQEKYEYMTGYKKYITINNSIMASTIGIHQK